MVNMNLYFWRYGNGWEWIAGSEKAFLFNYFGDISSSPLITQGGLEPMVGIVDRPEFFLASKYILKIN